ncbi:sulfite exporter TauE/SafE family protein [Oceanospirillum sediminis]|uniref:Probable membrane transporter protein n=1 Tax=Oceanospirillum sediminis TaxID=2760088 RepID=A0A839IR47_9GAMM|nr:sulfite exporter TauE/SafE family protein [Oceanospirillum sediminis]MBB1487755.1 sulfite exporter TauE/SafE family protein [Oceanospirillum sediminis]
MIEPVFMLYYIITGMGVGFLAGLAGVGGGGMTVPIFTMLFAMQGVDSDQIVHLALGSSMAGMVFTTFGSMKAHYQNQNVDTVIAVRMITGVLAGTFLATFIASWVQGVYLALFFSIFMMYVAWKMFSKRGQSHNVSPHGTKGNLLAGSAIGSVSALVSISGAGLSVPYLIQQNMEAKRAIGTSAAIGFPIALSGTLGYLINGWDNTSQEQLIFGYIYLPAVVLFAASSYITTSWGVKYATQMPAERLKKIVGILCVILSVKMLIGVL